jgi:thiamine-monophosphate kinase
LIDHPKNFEINQASTLKGIVMMLQCWDFKDKKVVISTDILVEGSILIWPTCLKHLGYKAVTTNISDICAMNAKATQITVSSPFLIVFHWSVRWIAELHMQLLNIK